MKSLYHKKGDLNKRIFGLELEIPHRLTADHITMKHNYGRFIAEPLRRGFGTTIGHSLKKILLSFTRGIAITSVSLNGLQAKSSSISGVVEDVADIILNLKQIRLRGNGDVPVQLSLSAYGVGEVTAADITPSNGIEIVNPDQHIATLNNNGKLEMTLNVAGGVGYVPADTNESLNGAIPIDAIFSPVWKADYQVEEVIGSVPNTDKLVLEVWTDGSITPKEAIVEASKFLIGHLLMLTGASEEILEIEDEEEDKGEQVDEELLQKETYLDTPVSEIEMSVRCHNCLRRAGITTIREVVQKTETEMLSYKNFGKVSLDELKEILTKMGLSFGMKL